MNETWKIRKKGYLKIQVAVNIKTKKILSVKVTNERVQDSKALPGLFDDITKSKNTTVDKILADGSNDSKDIFSYRLDNNTFVVLK